MKIAPIKTSRTGGSSLIESVLAMGVLAVAIPLVFGALAESGKSGMSAEAETRSTWMIPVCMAEIQASRAGKPQYFTATTAGQTFPPGGEVWVLGFSAEGKPVGKISKAAYDKGARQVDGKPVRYMISLSAATITPPTGATPMLRTRLSLEYPSTAPLAKRQKLEFHTHVP